MPKSGLVKYVIVEMKVVKIKGLVKKTRTSKNEALE